MNNTHTQEIDQCVTILEQGGLVIFPTDTAFGIGCRMDNEESIKRLFQIRKRPTTQATPVLVSSIEMAESYFINASSLMKEYMTTYWPGALTIIGQCDPTCVPHLVRGGTSTIGLRMPNNQSILTVIKTLGVPVLGPSANFHGLPTPYSFSTIDPDLAKLVDFVLPGECSVGLASTVVDCTMEPPHILRQGSVVLPLS